MYDTSGYLYILLKHKLLYVHRIYSNISPPPPLNRRLPRINTVRASGSGGGGRVASLMEFTSMLKSGNRS